MSRFILISLEEFVSLLNKADTECTLSEGLTFYGGRLSDYDDWLIKKNVFSLSTLIIKCY
jgi:hypothetical protein